MTIYFDFKSFTYYNNNLQIKYTCKQICLYKNLNNPIDKNHFIKPL